MTESAPRPIVSERLAPKEQANFKIACEYRTADETNGVTVTRFGAIDYGPGQNPAIQRTVHLATDLETSVEVQAYPLSEPSLLIGLVRHLAAGKSERERLDLHQRIVSRRDQYAVEPTDPAKFNQVPGTCINRVGLSAGLAKPTVTDEILADLGWHTGSSTEGERLRLVEQASGVSFRRALSVHGGVPEDLSEDELDDYVPPIIGYQEAELFTIPDQEMISFIAALSKSNRGRVHPDDMLATLDGLLPAKPDDRS